MRVRCRRYCVRGGWCRPRAPHRTGAGFGTLHPRASRGRDDPRQRQKEPHPYRRARLENSNYSFPRIRGTFEADPEWMRDSVGRWNSARRTLYGVSLHLLRYRSTGNRVGNPVSLIIAHCANLGEELPDKGGNENVVQPRLECRIDLWISSHSCQLGLLPACRTRENAVVADSSSN